MSSLVQEILDTTVLLSNDLGKQLLTWRTSPSAYSTRSADPRVDIGIYLIYTFVCFCSILTIRHGVLNPLARRIVKDSRDVRKFGDSGTEFFLYGVFSVIGSACVLNEPWLWPSSGWWPREQSTLSNAIRCWYLLDSGRYTASLLSLVFFEHRRKDFVQMFVHHVVTIFIMVVSYGLDMNRLGAVIKLVMDPADVPLHGAKLFKYCGQKFMADRCFELFALTFFVMRLVMYGGALYITTYACMFQAAQYNYTVGVLHYTCFLGLWILLALQIYWFHLVMKMAYKIFFKGEDLEDIRSDDDDDEPKGEKQH